MKTSNALLFGASLLASTTSSASTAHQQAPTLTSPQAVFDRLGSSAPKMRFYRYKPYSTLLRERALAAEAAQDRFPPGTSLALFAPLVLGIGYLGLKTSKKEPPKEEGATPPPQDCQTTLSLMGLGQRHPKADRHPKGAA